MLALFILGACGTHVFNHEVAITIDDPARRLAEPATVSVFRKSMGYSRDWAMRDLGVATAARPYVGYWSTEDAVAVGDSGPRPRLDLSFALPQLTSDGYFFVQLEPADGVEKVATAEFTSYGVYFPDGRGPSLPVRYVARRAKNGWRVELTVEVPKEASIHERDVH